MTLLVVWHIIFPEIFLKCTPLDIQRHTTWEYLMAQFKLYVYCDVDVLSLPRSINNNSILQLCLTRRGDALSLMTSADNLMSLIWTQVFPVACSSVLPRGSVYNTYQRSVILVSHCLFTITDHWLVIIYIFHDSNISVYSAIKTTLKRIVKGRQRWSCYKENHNKAFCPMTLYRQKSSDV